MDFLKKDFTIPSEFLILLLVFSFIIFLRYLLFSELYQRWIYNTTYFRIPRRIISTRYPLSQKQKEIMWSGISSTLFGLVAVIMVIAWQRGYTAIYVYWFDYPLWYLPISLAGALFIHETYYYWLHRLLHHPRIFKKIHKVHHDSISTSVWTSFSFHPLESLLQAIIIPLIVLAIPLHISVLVILLIIMTVSALINHAGVEIYPGRWRNHPVFKWLIGSTHHDLHHRRFVTNYGLYFTFWDIWMGTESPEYQDAFEKNTRGNSEVRNQLSGEVSSR